MARRAIQTISHNGKEYFSLNHASSLCGYHRDYLGQLIRGGKLIGEKIDSSWFVEKTVFARFCEKNHIASFLRSEENITKGDFVNQELLKEVQGLKTKLAKFEKDPSINSGQDPWDELLLGNDFQSARKPRFLEFLKSLSFNPALLKPALMIVAISAAGTFIIRNPQLVQAGVKDISDFVKTSSDFVKISAERIALGGFEFINDISFSLDKIQAKTELALNKISLDKINLAQVQQATSFNFNELKNSAVSAQSFLEKSLLNFGRKSGVLANEQSKETIKNLTNLPQKAGGAAGRVLNKTQDGLADLPKQVLGLFNLKAPWKTLGVDEKTPSVEEGTPTESVGAELSPAEEESVKAELSQLLSQGLTSEPTVQVEQTVVEKTIERIISGLSQKELDTAVAAVNSRILAEVSELKGLIQKKADENFRAIALSNRINNLSGVTLTNPKISGTVSDLKDSDIPNDITVTTSNALTGTSASFSSNVTISGTLDVTGALTASSISFSNASTSLSSVFKTLYVGGTATTTIVGSNATSTFAQDILAQGIALSIGSPFLQVGGTATTTIRGDNLFSTIPFASTTALTVSGTASTTNQVFSAMTSGSLLFAGTGGLLSQDNSNLFWDDTNNRLGIGTTTPQWLLNPFSATAPQLALSAGGGFGQWTFRNAGGDLFVATTTVAGTATTTLSALTIISSSGNVGIATSTPGALFAVSGAGYLTGNLTADGIFRSNSASASVLPYASSTALTVSGTGFFGTASTTNLTVSILNSGRVPYITTAGAFTDDSDLTFSGSILTATNASTTALTVSGTASTTNQVFSAMTSGSLLFAGTGGLLSQDNSNLFWDDTNNTLGIGTTTQQSPRANLFIQSGASAGRVGDGTNKVSLHIAAIGSGGSDVVSINNIDGVRVFGITSSGNAILRVGTSTIGTAGEAVSYFDTPASSAFSAMTVNQIGTGDILQLKDNYSTVFTVRDGGNVGIGSTTPGVPLAVDAGSALSGNALILENNAGSGGDSIAQQFSITGGLPIGRFVFNLNTDAPGRSFDIQVANGSNVLGTVMTLDGSNSRVGIGTTSPATLLALHAADPIITLGDSTATGNQWRIRNGVLGDGIFDIFNLDDNASRLVVDASGNVGIATTTPGAKLNIIGALCVDDTTPTCANSARTDGTIYSVAALSATLDLAEAYPTKDNTLEAGELLALDEQNPVYVKRASGTSTPIGVVSTAPGFYLGGFADTLYPNDKKVPAALSGRVPVKVNNEGGSIAVGDRIALSSVAGVGKKATTSVETVGIALESMTGSSGTIEVFVNLRNQIVPSQLTVDSSGNVGIGTLTPAYKLHVIGDVAATSFVNISTRSSKKDITYISEGDKDSILEKLKTVQVAQYRYEFEGSDAPLRIGLIAEESPAEILSASGGGVDIYKLSTFTLSAVQALQIDLAELTARVAAVEGAGGSGSGGVSIQAVLDYLAGLGVQISQAITRITNLAVGTIRIENQLCVDDVCVNKEQLKALLIQAGGTSTLGVSSSTPSVLPPADIEAPVITIIGLNPAEIAVGATYGDLGVTVADNVDQNLGYTASLDAGPEFSQGDGLILDTSAAGAHTISYKAVDNAGNIGTAERIVNVVDPTASTTPTQ